MWENWTAAALISLVAAVFDVGARRIPNFFTGPAFLGGLIWAFVQGGWECLLHGFLGSLVLMAPYLFLFVFAKGGAGDAKLAASLGAWLGVKYSAIALVFISAAGLLLGIGFAISKRRFGAMLKNMGRIFQALLFWVFGKLRLSDAQAFLPESKELQAMPYGVAICAGICLAAVGCLIWKW